MFVDGPVTAVLRLLRTVLFLGSSGLLIWLLGLVALVVVGRTANQRVARLPFGHIVVRVFAASLVVSVSAPLIGVAGAAGAAGAAGIHRVAASYTDSGGGQRWPTLPPPLAASIATTVRVKAAAPVATTVAATVGTNRTIRVKPTPGRSTAMTLSTTRTTTKVTTTTPATAAKINGPAGPRLVFALASPAAIPNAASPDWGVSATPAAQRVVRRGECFWSIAETLVLNGTDEATEADVAHYWQKLIEANRSKLPDPANPDLLWAGTVLDLPALLPQLPTA